MRDGAVETRLGGMSRLWIAVLLIICGAAFAEGASNATRILIHGNVVPMTSPDERHEAVAIAGNRILAVGSNEEILALAGPETERIDLAGAAVYPGFIDPHAHYLSGSGQAGLSFEQAQVLALSYGITATAEMYATPELLDDARALDESGEMRLRMSLYLLYNDLCGEMLGPWYIGLDRTVDADSPFRVRIGGVKIFAERSSCGDQILGIAFSSDLQQVLSPAGRAWYGRNKPHFSAPELASIIRQAGEAGYPVAVHAMGDAGVGVVLDAVEEAFGGPPPEGLRPMILHNLFVRDDQIPRYEALGITAAVEGITPCFVDFYDDLLPGAYASTVRRWGDLVAAGLPVTANSDWPWCEEADINPLFRLLALISPENVSPAYADWAPCDPLTPGQTVSRWEGLRMITINAAYALHREHELGTLEPGKLADLVVLSADPLTVDAQSLKTITVVRTIIDGATEWVEK